MSSQAPNRRYTGDPAGDSGRVAGHVTEFAKMLPPGMASGWMTGSPPADASDLPDLDSSTTRIKRDYDAVLDGLTLPWSSGAAEGNVRRIKMIKRQMYGRATFESESCWPDPRAEIFTKYGSDPDPESNQA